MIPGLLLHAVSDEPVTDSNTHTTRKQRHPNTLQQNEPKDEEAPVQRAQPIMSPMMENSVEATALHPPTPQLGKPTPPTPLAAQYTLHN